MEKQSRFAELIRLQKESGLTARNFCANEGIAPSTFYYWHKKLSPSKKGKGFIPIIVKPSESALTSRYDRGNQHQEEENLIELIYPNGTKMRIKKEMNLSELRALIHLYD